MEEERNVYKVLVGKPRRKEPIQKIRGIDGRMGLELILVNSAGSG
jgi:hypothetical protein